MKIRFVKDIEVQYWNSQYNEISEKAYRRGAQIEIVTTELVDKNFVNLHFDNADLAIDVPKSAFVIII
jgi:hypothetical protein